MANNLLVTPGVGATVGAESINGVLYSQAKMIDGTSGATLPIGVPSNPWSVALAGSSLPSIYGTAALPTAQLATLTPPATYPIIDSQGTRQAVTFTSGTPADTANTVAISTYANVAVSLHYSGIVTGGQMYFEVSDDNSNWYGITLAPTDAATDPADNYTLSSASGGITWQMFVGAYAYFRVRMHLQVVGAGSAIVAIIPSTIAAEPAIALAGGFANVGVTSIASIYGFIGLAGGSNSIGFVSVPSINGIIAVNNFPTTLTSLASGTLIGLNPSSNFIGLVSTASIQGNVAVNNFPTTLTSLASGTFVSLNPGSNFIGLVSTASITGKVQITNAGLVSNASLSTTFLNDMILGQFGGGVGGSLASGSFHPIQVDSNGNTIAVGNIASGASDSGNPVKVGGVYNSTLPTLTTGQRGDVQLDAKAIPMVNNAYKLDAVNDAVAVGDGTNTANILKSDGSAAGQNAVLTAGSGYTTATLTLNSGSPNTAWYDMLNYAWVSVEILTNTTPATLTFQTSGDASQSNIVNTGLIGAGGASFTATTTSATGSFHGPRSGRYFRISSNNGAGTTTLVITFYTNPNAMPIINSNQNGTWTVGSNSATGSAVPANAFYMGALNASGNLAGIPISSALADANPGPALAVNSGLFNNSTYDRDRNNYNTTTGDTPTIVTATTTNGATQINYNAKGAIITAILGTVSGTTPAMQLQLQWSPDVGTTWLNYGPASTSLLVATGNTLATIVYPTALTATLLATTTTADNAQINAPLPRTWRMTYITTGTGISIAVASVNVNYIN